MKQSLVGGKKSCLELFRREFQRDIQKRPKQLQKGTTFQLTENTKNAIQRKKLHFAAHVQEIQHGSELPHRPQVPPRQLRRRRWLHQRSHDLAALRRRRWRRILLLRRRLLLYRRRRGMEARGGAHGARAGGAGAPGGGRRRSGGGFLLRIGDMVRRIGFRRGSLAGN